VPPCRSDQVPAKLRTARFALHRIPRKAGIADARDLGLLQIAPAEVVRVGDA
jgi:hypothetical protein